MPERTRDGEERAIAWSVVVLVHAAIVATLVRMPLPGHASTSDAALTIEFIERRRPAATPAPEEDTPRIARDGGRSTAAKPRVGQVANTMTHSDGASPHDGPAATTTVADDQTVRPLDLHVPGVDIVPPRGRGLDRAPSLEPRPTRFSRAWMPEGDALEQASFRSPAVRAALALFGGPPRRCSEVERRLRRPDCLPLHGQEAEDEMLLRALDERASK